MSQPTVLIVEDNQDDFFLLERAFKKAEIATHIRWVKDGIEAKAYLSDNSPAARSENPLPVVILADIKMPRMDGFELLTWVRTQSPLRRIPYILLTSSSQVLDINKAYDLGANSYLVKPGNFEQLMHLSKSLKQYWLMLNQSPDFPG